MVRQISSLPVTLYYRVIGKGSPGILSRPLGRVRGRDIDAALMRCGLDRADLFRSDTAIARHRRRLSRMLAAHCVDIDRLVATRWDDLKRADHRCAYCDSVRRCEWWLADDGRSEKPDWHADIPRRFCPNAAFFDSLSESSGGERSPSAARS